MQGLESDEHLPDEVVTAVEAGSEQYKDWGECRVDDWHVIID